MQRSLPLGLQAILAAIFGHSTIPGEPNLLRLKYRDAIRDIIRAIITEKVSGPKVVPQVRSLIEGLALPDEDAKLLFQAIETEIVSLHEDNVVRFRIRPIEFQEWKALQ